MAVSGLSLVACTLTTPTSGHLADSQRLLVTCGPKPPVAFVALDATGSSNGAAITAERLAAVKAITTRTAVCAGRLRVLAFSSSSVATVTLLDQALRPYGATTNARLKRVPALVDQAMTSVSQGYASALRRLPRGGSDIIGQFRHAAEWQRQLGTRGPLHLYVFSDGFQTGSYRVGGSKALTEQRAKALAGKPPMPKLPGAIVIVAGLGRVAGKPPRSVVVEGLVAYYTALCQRTGAASCLAVTDYERVGR